MKIDFKTLDLVLKESIRRNGDEKPLTLGHLRNLLRVVENIQKHDEAFADRQEEKQHQEILQGIDPLGQEGTTTPHPGEIEPLKQKR